MQRKEIEKIPYLNGSFIQNADIKYVTAAAVKIVKNKKTLLVEIYSNSPSKLNIPIVRICLSKDDFENYYPKEKKWSKQRLERDYCNTEILGKYMGRRTFMAEVNFSESVRYTVANFLKQENNDNPYIQIVHAEEEIVKKREEIKEKNNNKKIKELIDSAPVHSKDFYEWAKSKIPQNYMYYLRKGNTVFLTCTHCGNREKYYTGYPETVEDNAKTYIEVPKNEGKCVCKFCGASATYRQEGHYKGEWSISDTVYDIQNSNGKAIITMFNVKKTYFNGEPEKYEFRELIKAVYTKGRKTSDKTYNPYGRWVKTNGTMGWGGWSNDHITLKDVKLFNVYGIRNLKGTPLEYSAMSDFYKNRGEISPIRYADAYLKNNEIEMLSKMGLTYIVLNTISKGKQIYEGKKPYQMLRIFPDRLNMLIKSKGAGNVWSTLKFECLINTHLSDEEIKIISNKAYIIENIKDCLKYTSFTKFKNYMEKNKWNVVEYRDYLKLKDDAGYDMNDSIILFPSNLHEAHQRIIDEINIAKTEKRMEEKNKTYADIAKNFKKLNVKFGYKTENFIIRPAKDAGEIIQEGQRLHHCVGSSDTYMFSHNCGKSYILMLRKASEPDVSYCTIEISPEFKIIQWQQAYDKKPDASIIKPLLDEYIKAKTLIQNAI